MTTPDRLGMPFPPSEQKVPASAPAQSLGWTEIQLVKRHPSILARGHTVLVLIDLQERLMTSMHAAPALRDGVIKLLRAAEILDVPVIVTEQYRKGLGRTDAALEPHMGRARVIEKLSFSAVGEKAFISELDALKPTHVLLAGIETHVCVAQTALDLLVRGYTVSVAADAVSSRRPADRDVALSRLRAAGVTVSTGEALILELTEEAGTPEFKRILELIK